MRNLCLVLGIIGVVGTAVPIIRHQAWWIRIFDFPRLQLAGVCLLSVALYGLISFRETGGPFDHFLAAAAALCFIHQARQIFPYTPFASRQVQNAGSPLSPASLRLLVSNVLMTNRRADRFRQIVKDSDPDVILVAEPDEWWEQQLRPLETRYSPSSPGEFHPQALTDPDVTVSRHPARIISPPSSPSGLVLPPGSSHHWLTKQ